MVIVKLRRPFQETLNFLPYEGSFMWKSTVTFASYTQPTRYDSSFDFTLPSLNATELEIGNVYVDNVSYDNVASVAACQLVEETYYFDIINQELYIHIDHDKRMTASEFNALKIRGYSSDTVFYDDNDIEFLPYLSSAVKLSTKADRLVYDKMSFVNNSLSFENAENFPGVYEFDDTPDSPVPGADVNVLYISQEDFESGNKVATPIYTGFAAGDSISYSSYNLKVADKRSQYNGKIPSTYFNSTDFIDIDDKVNGKVIPEGYGDILGAPSFCTNGTITTGNVNYKYCTDGTSVTTVYVKTDDAWNSVTPVSTDPTNGEYILSATDARDASGNPKESKCDARFRDLDSPADIIADMITRYLNYPYTTQYFNTTNWVSEGAYLADIYLYMGERKTFYECVEMVQNSSDYGFRFDIDAAGKYTLKVDDISRATTATIPYVDNISALTPASRDFTQYASSVRVFYNIDQESKTGPYVDDTDYEEDALDLYRYEKEAEYTSGLTNSTDAAAKAARIALDYSVARNEISFTLEHITRYEIYDIIVVDTSVYIDGVKIRDYMGERKIKISGVEWDFLNETTKISGYDITGV